LPVINNRLEFGAGRVQAPASQEILTMDTNTLANTFVALLKKGQFKEAGDTFWADNIVSIEPMGDQRRWEGRAAVQGKSDWWESMHEVHALSAEGPYVNNDQFVVKFHMDITHKETKQRIVGDEMGLYKVKDGKIVEESFYMTPMG
jgi:SnoaL-like domain